MALFNVLYQNLEDAAHMQNINTIQIPTIDPQFDPPFHTTSSAERGAALQPCKVHSDL